MSPAGDGGDRGTGRSGWPVAAALAMGFLAGATLAFGIRFLGLLPGLGDAMARRTLVLCGMGMLGATVYGSVAWTGRRAPDGEGPDPGPPIRRFVLHLATVAGGGVAGLVLYLAVKAAIAGALVGGGTPRIRFSAAVVIAFSGGLLLAPLRRRLVRPGRSA